MFVSVSLTTAYILACIAKCRMIKTSNHICCLDLPNEQRKFLVSIESSMALFSYSRH